MNDNLPFTDRTARNYMRMYHERDRLKTETVSDLTGAYKLIEHKKRNQLNEEEKRFKERKEIFKAHHSIRFERLQDAWRGAENSERKEFLRYLLRMTEDTLRRYRATYQASFSENDKPFYSDIDKRCIELILQFGFYYNDSPKRLIHK